MTRARPAVGQLAADDCGPAALAATRRDASAVAVQLDPERPGTFAIQRLDHEPRRPGSRHVELDRLLLALSQRPDLLVLDEPTDGLDPVVRREVMTAVVDFVSARGATVFISATWCMRQSECATGLV